jgi:hypothetical protein
MTERKTSPELSSRRHVYLLDYLMSMRQNMRRQLLMSMGCIDIARMAAFVDGYRACQYANGIQDEEYGLFFEWLRDVKHEFPGEGWGPKYLRDCDGDHERAIQKYLDFVAEFVALRERERQGA